MGGFKDFVRWLLPSGQKASAAGPLVGRFSYYGGRGHPSDMNLYSLDGYQRNAVVYRCVSLIARSAAKISLHLVTGEGGSKKRVDNHPLLDLLKRPNPMQGGAAFVETVLAWKLITGNSYIEATGTDGRIGKPPAELYSLPPKRMKVTPGNTGLPTLYTYEMNGQKIDWPVDVITGRSAILHLKMFNPLDDWYGMSPMEAAAFDIDQHNAAGEWNYNLLKNQGKTGGAVVYDPKDDAEALLSQAQRDRLREELDTHLAGAKNAGKIMIWEGGLRWEQMALNNLEMDWLNGRSLAATDIAMIYHIAPQLVGVAGSQTFANYEQAREALLDDAVLPLLDSTLDDLNHWLVPMFDATKKLRLEYDDDDIPALAGRRARKWESVDKVSFLELNEKREAVGFDAVEGGDVILVSSSMVPLDIATDPNAGLDPADPNNPNNPDAEPTLPEDAAKLRRLAYGR